MTNVKELEAVSACKELDLEELKSLSAIGGQDEAIQSLSGGCLISVTVVLYSILKVTAHQ